MASAILIGICTSLLDYSVREHEETQKSKIFQAVVKYACEYSRLQQSNCSQSFVLIYDDLHLTHLFIHTFIVVAHGVLKRIYLLCVRESVPLPFPDSSLLFSFSLFRYTAHQLVFLFFYGEFAKIILRFPI